MDLLAYHRLATDPFDDARHLMLRQATTSDLFALYLTLSGKRQQRADKNAAIVGHFARAGNKPSDVQAFIDCGMVT